MLSNIKFRLIKLHFEDNRWKSFRVRDRNQLDNLLKKYKPKNSYYSISEYLNPLKIEHPRSKVDEVILNSDLIIETDSPSIKNLRKILKLMEKKKYDLIYLLNSGRGYHCVYKSKTKFFKKERLLIVNALLKSKINFDEPVTTDLNRVCRIPRSWNGNRGVYSRLLSSEDIEGLTENESSMTEDINAKTKEDQATSTEPSSSEYLSTRVRGNNKNQILFLKYRDMFKAEKDIKRLELGCICYFFDFKEFIGVITLKCWGSRKIKKIGRKSRALNQRAIMKYSKQYIRISEQINTDTGEIIKDKPLYIGKINLSLNKPYFCSKTHIPFMTNSGIDLEEEFKNILIGDFDEKVVVSRWC